MVVISSNFGSVLEKLYSVYCPQSHPTPIVNSRIDWYFPITASVFAKVFEKTIISISEDIWLSLFAWRADRRTPLFVFLSRRAIPLFRQCVIVCFYPFDSMSQKSPFCKLILCFFVRYFQKGLREICSLTGRLIKSVFGKPNTFLAITTKHCFTKHLVIISYLPL